MGLFGGKKKSSSELPQEIEKIFEKIARVMEDEEFQNSMYSLSIKNQIVSGPDLDKLPDGVGEFGRSEGNPIPVNGPIGELVYLSNLRTKDGQRLLYHRLGSVGSIDIYETVSIDGSMWDILFFSMYHPRKSRIVPSAYSIANARERSLLYGTNRRVNSFPYGLQDAIRNTTVEMFGMPIRPPQVRQAEENVKFQRPREQGMRVRSLVIELNSPRDPQRKGRGINQVNTIHTKASTVEFHKDLQNTIQKYYKKNEVPIAVDDEGAKLLKALIEETGTNKPVLRRLNSWVSDKVITDEKVWEAVRPYLCIQLRKRMGNKAWIDTDGKPLDEGEAIAKFALVLLHVYVTDDVLVLMDKHKIPKPEFVVPSQWFSRRIQWD